MADETASSPTNRDTTPAGGPTPVRALIVDNDPIVADSLAEFLRGEGHDAISAFDGSEALARIEAGAEGDRPFDVVLCDVSMPGMSGLELLRVLARDYREIAVIMFTGYGTIESAVETLRIGASDYLTKPIVDDELRVSLERVLRQRALLVENKSLRTQLDQRYGLDSVIGTDHRMQRVFQLIESVAPSRTTVLMTGESGTGKSMVARAIHQRSPRADNPFVELACGSIPETLLESELFGHAKGAFTGAHADKIGKFLAADGGTIFLDEINSASPAMQLKLLRVLQEKRFEPVGSTETIECDVRVLLASNQPLEDLVSRGEFRQDLYYRINVVNIELPPLRERVGDIRALADSFREHYAEELGRQIVGFSAEALDALRRYPFPGNVRELRNIIERAAVLSQGQTIGIDDLPAHVLAGDDRGMARPMSIRDGGDDDSPWVPMPLQDALRDPERRIILKALRANDWNRQRTAEDLDINRTTLYKKMKALGIDEDDRRAAG